MPAFCEPPGRGGGQRRTGVPSEERLEAADIHSLGLAQAGLAELAMQLPNRTFMLQGDSVMEQFYNALQCFARKEELELPLPAAFEADLERQRPLWMVGKRKMAPKLPVQTRGGMRMLFSRAIKYESEDLTAAMATSNVLVINWGLHYHKMDQYREDLHAAFFRLNEHAAKQGNAVLFRETGAQHFKTSDKRGYGGHGEWERRDKSTDAHCSCAPIEDFGVNRQNGVLHEVLGTGRYPHVRILPFYGLTRPRWRWHFGNCTHRPDRWNYDTCCDCTHFCYSPGMWRAHLHDLVSGIS
uniref:Uncharacterized protein n=2 Tax=Emiliania huxleyi TaxID=2903 RepID=A0A7S3X3Q8_EMIHU